VGDTFYFGGSRGIEAGSTTDDFLIPRVAGAWQTSNALYSLPGASTPLVVGQSYVREGAAGNVDEEVVPCFVKGTLVKTARGEVAVESLVKGDLVLTRDNGYQPIQWIGFKTVAVNDKTAPIRFETGTMGNDRPLMVSPNHRMLLCSADADLLFGDPEVLIPAKHLTKLRNVAKNWSEYVTYVHILFASHEIIYANGAMSESFFPGEEALNAMGQETKQEVLDLFPELAQISTSELATARTCLKPHEASILMSSAH
jgi:hypothetical protein